MFRMLGRFIERIGCFVTFAAVLGIFQAVRVFGDRFLWGLTTTLGLASLALLVVGFVVMAFGGWVQRPTRKVRVVHEVRRMNDEDDEDNGFRRSWTLWGQRTKRR